MYTTWFQAQAAGRSPLNVGRSTARNKRKSLRSKENAEYRAQLQRQKDNSDAVKKDMIQSQINEISKRK